MNPSRPMRGIALKLASVLVFIVMAAMIKMVAAHIPAGQTVFFRSLFAIPVIVIWLAVRGEVRSGLRTNIPMGHIWRGLMGTTAMGLGFAGLAYLPLPEVTAIGYAAPLLTVILAAMFLGEEVRAFRIGAVLLGMLGVVIVIYPRLTVLDGTSFRDAFGAALVLGGAVFASLAQITVRKLVASEETATIVLWFSLTATILSLGTLPFGWVMPTPFEAALLVMAGLLGGVGQIFLTASYREADASVVAPFDYASMIFSLGFGYFLFAEVPSLSVLGGAGLVILAGIVIIWRERQLGLERARQRRSAPMQG